MIIYLALKKLRVAHKSAHPVTYIPIISQNKRKVNDLGLTKCHLYMHNVLLQGPLLNITLHEK